MKKNAWNRFLGLVAGRGFYIVLLLCVAALGISGYYLYSGITSIGRAVSGTVSVTVTPPPAVTAPAGTRAPVSTPRPEKETVLAPPATASPVPLPTVKPTPAPTAAPSPAPTPKATAPADTATASVFTWPVKGEILRPWAVEALAYDPTMGDWRTHDGVDIACAVGTQVLAPAGGTVSDLYHDDLMGTCVVILHADGVMSTCANLAAVPTVEIGDTVRTGDIIGSVGQSAIAESGEASHLHLSMTKNGVSVDPLDYLPERKY